MMCILKFCVQYFIRYWYLELRIFNPFFSLPNEMRCYLQFNVLGVSMNVQHTKYNKANKTPLQKEKKFISCLKRK